MSIRKLMSDIVSGIDMTSYKCTCFAGKREMFGKNFHWETGNVYARPVCGIANFCIFAS